MIASADDDDNFFGNDASGKSHPFCVAYEEIAKAINDTALFSVAVFAYALTVANFGLRVHVRPSRSTLLALPIQPHKVTPSLTIPLSYTKLADV